MTKCIGNVGKNPRETGAELHPLRRLSAWRPVSSTAGRFLLRGFSKLFLQVYEAGHCRNEYWHDQIRETIAVLYVFGRWNPSDKIKLILPTVYYIPCYDQDTAGKLLKAIECFGVDNGAVVELAGMERLKGTLHGTIN